MPCLQGLLAPLRGGSLAINHIRHLWWQLMTAAFGGVDTRCLGPSGVAGILCQHHLVMLGVSDARVAAEIFLFSSFLLGQLVFISHRLFVFSVRVQVV